jgi:hypothetical protein
MALESASFVSGLVSTNPTGSDSISQGDDHLRLIKTVTKATFPNGYEAMNGIHTRATAPTSTSAGQLWFDTTLNLLKMRNEADSGWIIIHSSDGSNIIKVTRLEDSGGVNIRSTSMTDAATFSITKASATSNLLIQANIYSGLYNYGTAQTGTFQVYNATSAAVIGTTWQAGGQWNNLGSTSATNNEVRAWTTMTVKESTPLAAGTWSIKIRGTVADPSGGGSSTQDSTLTVWEIEE